MPLGVVDEDRRMVEAHRLRVEQRARVVRRIGHAQPRSLIRGARERRGVRLAEAELRKAGDALEDLLRHRLVEIVLDAAADEAVAELLHLHPRTVPAHRPAKPIRLAGGVSGDLHDDAQDLLLVEDDAACFRQNRL